MEVFNVSSPEVLMSLSRSTSIDMMMFAVGVLGSNITNKVA